MKTEKQIEALGREAYKKMCKYQKIDENSKQSEYFRGKIVAFSQVLNKNIYGKVFDKKGKEKYGVRWK